MTPKKYNSVNDLISIDNTASIGKSLTEMLGTGKSFADLYRPHASLSETVSSMLDPNLSLYDLRYSAPHREVESEIHTLRSKLRRQADELEAKRLANESLDKKIPELEETIKSLQQQQDLRHLLNRTHPEASGSINSDVEFRNAFLKAQQAYIMSVDIRRSTELMLKATSPVSFAEFIRRLIYSLREIIIGNYGVFDKFTGDGIIAFFPIFFSGEDAGYHALRAADNCHRIFSELYTACRSNFTSVPLNVGLGIGIDFGEVQAVRLEDDLTVVGTPVVYACRMSGCDAESTFVNQPAFTDLFERYSAYFNFKEATIEFKHEGPMLAYNVLPNGKHYAAKSPPWLPVPAINP
jgi:class 3 adenylate cyclase